MHENVLANMVDVMLSCNPRKVMVSTSCWGMFGRKLVPDFNKNTGFMYNFGCKFSIKLLVKAC